MKNNSAPNLKFKPLWLISGLVLLSLLAILVVSVLRQSKTISQLSVKDYAQIAELKATLQKTYTPEIKKLIEGDNNPWLGATEPMVTIVEFSDFACPYCRNAQPIIRQIGFKYQDKVKVYTVGDPAKTADASSESPTFSREVCGGPHVENTGTLGKFKITKEEAVGAGVRRIKAVLE